MLFFGVRVKIAGCLRPFACFCGSCMHTYTEHTYFHTNTVWPNKNRQDGCFKIYKHEVRPNKLHKMHASKYTNTKWDQQSCTRWVLQNIKTKCGQNNYTIWMPQNIQTRSETKQVTQDACFKIYKHEVRPNKLHKMGASKYTYTKCGQTSYTTWMPQNIQTRSVAKQVTQDGCFKIHAPARFIRTYSWHAKSYRCKSHTPT